MGGDLVRRYRIVAQKPRELHLPTAFAGKPADTGAWPLNQCRVQIGPPFCRRQSPNRPRPYSMPDINVSRESSIDPWNQACNGEATEMCEYDSPCRGRYAEFAAPLSHMPIAT